jgi:heme-degrading monooxygenase HmoA
MPNLTAGRVRHGVVYSLKHAPGSPEEADFLQANAALASIPGVEAFELLREVSPKNDYRFALVMEFADREAYEAYNSHPDHVGFVRDRWDNEVTDFLELDSEALELPSP